MMEQQLFWTAPCCGHVPGIPFSPEPCSSGIGWFLRRRYIPVKLGALRQCETWEVFIDPSLSEDNGQDKKSYGSPDFRLGELKAGLWVNTVDKPVRVESQLARIPRMMRPPASSSNSIWSYDPSRTRWYTGDVTVEACMKLCVEGHLTDAVNALGMLVQTGMTAPTFLFYAILRKCLAQRNLVLGQRVHALTVHSGYESNTFLANHIMRIYASKGRLQEAMDVFMKVATPDAFMWSSIISAHAEHGKPEQGIRLYQEMRRSSVKPDAHVFVAVLKACGIAADLESGRQVHADVMEGGLQFNVFVGSSLLDMYAKCGRLEDARRIFDSLPTRDVVTWTAMITRYAEHGLGHEALALYATMEQEGMIVADRVTFACLLKACASIGALQEGKQLHAEIVGRGLKVDVFVGSCLVDMYAKCGSLQDALNVFNDMPAKDVVTWTALIDGYANHGLGHEALAVYARMELEGLTVANNITFSCMLKACGSIGALQQGKQIHLRILKRGLTGDIILGNSLLDMYVKCGSLEDAHKVLDSWPSKDVVTWTAMIAGYAEQGLGHEALGIYARMQEEGMVVPNSCTLSCLLKACASIGALPQGKELHAQILEQGLEADVVLGNCLVDMYARCGSLEDARRVFDSLATRDMVAWNAIIAGYVEHGLGQEALALYAELEQEAKVVVNNCTFAFLLKACASAGAVQQGTQLHSQLLDRGLDADLVVGASLVDMYAKFGRLEDARKVFDSLSHRDVITWTALLNGYSKSNQGQLAIQCFQEMLKDGVRPDETTFTCLLNACSHEGLVNVGRQYFDAMVKDHSILPTTQHYMCMADLLGRAGHLDEAENMLLTMPFESDVVGWTSLLYACRSHSDLERGRRCFESIVKLDPQNASAYVLMANIYADAGRWIDVNKLERLRQSAGACKKPAKAGIEVNRQVCTFIVGEEKENFSKLKSMNVRLKEEGGHVPHTELVLKQLSENDKEDELCGHAEKLALAYGLLNTPDGTPLLVTKNLRMCGDCHSATQVMSRIEKREITVRDSHRVHRFVDGSCSCGDRP